MTENTNDFSTARVGDRLWVRMFEIEGWCEVVATKSASAIYPIGIKSCFIPDGRFFTLNGALIEGGPQCVFWDKPQIIAPPRPKRMVKKMIEVRPYYGSQKKHIHLDEKPGQRGIQEEYYCGPVQPIEILIEEEE